MELHAPRSPPRSRIDQGIHLLAEWYGCDFSVAAMDDADALRAVCLRLTSDSGLQIVGESFHQFEARGVTGTVLLAQSHLAIHTWPDERFVTVDVYVCNYMVDNTQKALRLYGALKAHFQPFREKLAQIHRGGVHD